MRKYSGQGKIILLFNHFVVSQHAKLEGDLTHSVHYIDSRLPFQVLVLRVSLGRGRPAGSCRHPAWISPGISSAFADRR